MTKFNRRRCIQRTLAMLAGARTIPASAAASSAPAARSANRAGIKLALMLGPGQNDRFRLARQIGVNHAIVSVSGELSKVRREEYVKALAKIKSDFRAAGLAIAGVESHPVPAEKIKLGLPGRDEEIENYRAAIDALGRVGIPMVCYNFMAGLGWYRTRVDVPSRGGSLTSEFDYRIAEAHGPTEWGEVSEEKMWDNIEYFLKAVIPVADKANVKMAAHPDDPPVSPLRGIARILTSTRNFRRVLQLVPSAMSGVTFCQANFKAMGEDIEALPQVWLGQKKLFFVHFRDIEGDNHHFRETFHDNGPTDMARMLQVYSEGGFDGPIRPDHAPTLEDDSNARPGYAMAGKVLAIGYMKGLMDGLHIPYE
jgi:mannonate dehydratase